MICVHHTKLALAAPKCNTICRHTVNVLSELKLEWTQPVNACVMFTDSECDWRGIQNKDERSIYSASVPISVPMWGRSTKKSFAEDVDEDVSWDKFKIFTHTHTHTHCFAKETL